MSDQLHLLHSSSAWQLSNATREAGRRGVAAAREVLAEARARARAAELAEGHVEPRDPGPGLDDDAGLAPAA